MCVRREGRGARREARGARGEGRGARGTAVRASVAYRSVVKVRGTLELAVFGVHGKEGAPLAKVEHRAVETRDRHRQRLREVIVRATGEGAEVPDVERRIEERAGLGGVSSVEGRRPCGGATPKLGIEVLRRVCWGWRQTA